MSAAPDARGRWSFFIDRGGTFTDCIARSPETGRLSALKVLSGDDAPLLGMRALLGLPEDVPLPPCDVRLGTTLATNALLERRGVPCALVITRGFGDLLSIGTQVRPNLFELAIHKSLPLPAAIIETSARCDPEGEVVEQPDDAALTHELQRVRALGVDSVAVVVMHDHREGRLERHIADLARAAGFAHVVASHQAAPEVGLLARTDTTVLDAYLTPTLARSLASLSCELPGSTLRWITSGGALVSGPRFRGPDAVVSGPAGGVVALAALAEALGEPKVIGFDMGGTSTDVCRYAGHFERVYEGEVSGVRVRAPRMDLHTVAAGGGSYCAFDGVRATVGPESAGAHPGPLCYGRQGPQGGERRLTLTDVDLVLGRLVGDRFPIPLREDLSLEALRELQARMEAATGVARSLESIAWGFAEIADTAMAEAIRRVTVARGHDPREHALVVYGGAGGQHACAIARRLGVRRIFSHPLSGAFSALGLGLTRVGWSGMRGVGPWRLGPAGEVHGELDVVARSLMDEARAAMASEGLAPHAVRLIAHVDLRHAGTQEGLTLPLEPRDDLRARFDAAHVLRFGYARQELGVELTAVRVEALGPAADTRLFDATSEAAPSSSAPVRHQRMVVDESGEVVSAPVYLREALAGGAPLDGPALILDPLATFVLEPGFHAVVDAAGLLTVWAEEARGAAALATVSRGDAPDPMRVEVFNHLFMSIAEQMGDVLRRTALSTNIRERLDFSCALFDGDGALVANAPHIPVHLGAMGETVRAVREAFPEPRRGDVFVTNDPEAGGSHLPDITVVTPVFDARGDVRFFVASRGHHADVGGPTPGSMPPFSRTLADEGVVLAPTLLVREGVLDEASVRALLLAGPHPARRIDDNIADLVAQAAANHAGVRLLEALCAQHGADEVSAQMRHVQDTAARAVTAALDALPRGSRTFEDALDDGTVLRVRARVEGVDAASAHLHLDFAGTAGEHSGNLNAPRAVVTACVLYVLRTLVASALPLNAGCLRAVTVALPPRSLLSPSRGCAVVAGNVETSQRIVDVLLGALGLAAASQGTMNNLTFGDADIAGRNSAGCVAYYETICGGAGAGPGFAGASAVHTHMTNTRITDPEILEARFPVRLVRFEVRRGSGGEGRWRGGDGVIRELELLAPLRVSVLSQRRARAPFGLAGGAPGLRGRNFIDGREAGGDFSLDLPEGTRVRIETPGGGGYGEPLVSPNSGE